MKPDERVFHLDADQYRAGDGPCLEAVKTGPIVRVRVERAPRRWPQFHARAEAAGIGSYLSAPLTVDRRIPDRSTSPASSRTATRRRMGACSSCTWPGAGALRATSRHQVAMERVEQLREALTSRATIDQAKGIIMGARGIPAEEAFGVLVAQSQHENRELREPAQGIVDKVADSERGLGSPHANTCGDG